MSTTTQKPLTKDEIIKKYFSENTHESVIDACKDAMKDWGSLKSCMSEWVVKKPKLDKECLLVTASKIRTDWEYSIWMINWVHYGEDLYLGIFTGDGEEWGDIEDLKADKYLVLPLLKNKK